MGIADIAKSIEELSTQQDVKTVDFVSPLVLCLTMVSKEKENHSH